MDSVRDVCLQVCARDKKCTKCQGTTYLSACFLVLSMSDLCIYFWGIHICLAEHEYKHDSKKCHTRGSFQCSAADWHPLLSPAFLRSPAKEALMGVWRPVSGVLAKFTSHLESPKPGGTEALPAPLELPPSWSRSAMREPLSHQHLRNKSDTLLTATYSEAGGWGITWKEWYSWQIFSRLMEKNKIWRKGCFFWRGNSLQFKHTQIEWEIPPCVKYLESVIAGCW